jgi:hypothetical protein
MLHYVLSCDRQRIRRRAVPRGCERCAIIDGRPVAVHRVIQRLAKEAAWPTNYAHVLACNVGNEPGTSTEKLFRSNFQALSAKKGTTCQGSYGQGHTRAMTNLCLLNGAFCTQDPERPRAMAAAIRQGRFVPVGDDEIRNLIRLGTRIIDLEDLRVLPCLSGAHFHFYDWALGLQRLPLANMSSLADLRGRLAQRVPEPSKIAKAQVVMTVLGGAVV